MKTRHPAIARVRVPKLALQFTILCLAAFAILWSQLGHAGLYPQAAPPNSAYVRVFNGNAGGPVNAKIGEQTISGVAPYDASAFIFMPPGQYPASVGGASQTLNLQGNRYYTLALENGALKLFEQNGFSSQLKAMVSVFNLTDAAPLALKTADGKTAVVDNIGAQGSGQRELNAVPVSFAVYKGDAKLGDAKPVTLERGGVSSLFIAGSAEQPVLVWATK